MGTENWLLTNIHHNRRAGSISGFDHAWLQASLTKKRAVGVSQYAMDRDFMRKKSLEIRLAEAGIGICNLCHICRINAK